MPAVSSSCFLETAICAAVRGKPALEETTLFAELRMVNNQLGELLASRCTVYCAGSNSGERSENAAYCLRLDAERKVMKGME
jgi:hypothetical protein